jgi:hypothetical protein
MTAPLCAECGKTAALVGGDRIYPHRPDLFAKSFWLCVCGAYCGCHPGAQKPLGTPAGRELRNARMRVHALLDPIWKASDQPKVVRSQIYTWLADKLGIPPAECHAGTMSKETCTRAVAALTRLKFGDAA